MRRLKKFAAVCLSVCMLIGCMPAAVYAIPDEGAYDGMLTAADGTVFAYTAGEGDSKTVFTLASDLTAAEAGTFDFEDWHAEFSGVMLTHASGSADAVNTLVLTDVRSFTLAPKYRSGNGYLLYVNAEGKYGVLDTAGTVILAAGFDSISCYSEQNVFAAKSDGKWAVYSAAGALLTEFVFDSAPESTNECFLSGVIDGKAAAVCTLNGTFYDAAFDVSEGLIKIQKDGLFGFVNTRGGVVVEPVYDSAENFSNGLALVCGTELPNYYAYIGVNGAKVFDASTDYPNFGSFYNGCAQVENYEGKIGFINRSGVQIAAPEYDSVISQFNSNGVAVVKNTDGCFFIGQSGQKLVAEAFTDVRVQDGFFAATNTHGKCALYNSAALQVIEPLYDDMLVSQPYVYVKFNGAWGVTDTAGTAVLPCSYDGFEALGGVICLELDGAKLYFDKSKNAYDSVGSSENGFTQVLRDGKTGFVAANGSTAIPATLDAAPAFDENGIAVFSQNGKYGIMNSSYEIVLPAEYDGIDGFSGRSASVAETGGAFGIIDSTGAELVPAWFDCSEGFSSGGYAVLSDNNFFYAVSQDATIVRVLDRSLFPDTHAVEYSQRENAFVATQNEKYVLLAGEEYTVTSLRVSRLPDKTEYKDGLITHTGLDLTGLQVTAYFGGASKLLTQDELKIFAPEEFVLGENDITVEYMGKTTQFQIYVISGDRIITYPSAEKFNALWEGDTIEFTSYIGNISVELSVGDDSVTIADIENGKSVHLSVSGEFAVTVKLLDKNTATVLESEFYTLSVSPAQAASVDFAVKNDLRIGDSFSSQYSSDGAFATVSNLNYGCFDSKLDYSRSLDGYFFKPHSDSTEKAQSRVSDERTLKIYEPRSNEPAYAPGAFTVTASIAAAGTESFTQVGDAQWLAIQTPVITTNAPGSVFTETVFSLTATLENTSLRNSDNSEYTPGGSEHAIAYVPEFTVISGSGSIQEVTSDCTKTLFGLYKVVFTEGGAVTLKIKFNQICTCKDCLGEGEEFTGYSPETTVTINVNSDTRVLTAIYLTPPSKRDYYEGEEFNGTGMRLIAEYSDTSNEIITNYEMTGFENTVGTHLITVSYGGKSVDFSIRVFARELARIEITSQPRKLDYIEAQPLNTDGLAVIAVYNNGAEEDVTKACEISGYTGEVGTEQKVTVSYLGKETYFYVNVAEKSLQSIDVTTQPDKTVYYQGEEFDPTGMVVSKFFNNGTSEPTEDYSWRSFTLGSETLVVTITLNGSLKTKILRFTVLPKTLRSLEITHSADKLEYLEGEELDLTGFELKAVYNNSAVAIITEDMYTVTGYSSTPGSKTVVVSYLDKSVSFSVFVTPKTLTGIEISSLPASDVCYVGSEPDYTGLRVDALYDNNTRTQLTEDDYNISYIQSAADELTVKVEYLGFEDSFKLGYAEVAPCGIRVEAPAKRVYELGEELDLTGMKVFLVYNNGNTQELADTDYTLSGYDKDTIASHTITVTYVTNPDYTATFNVTVRNPVPAEITSDGLTVEDGFVKSLSSGMTASQLLASLNNSQYLKLFSGDTEITDPDALIGTGMTVKLIDGETTVDEVTVIVKGDLNGDGIVAAADARLALRAATGLENLSDAQNQAGNIDSAGGISAADARTILRVATKLEEFSV